MAFERRLGYDPLWTRELGPFPALREIAYRVRRRGSGLLNSLTALTSRLIEVTENGVSRTLARLKTTQMPRMSQLSLPHPLRRSPWSTPRTGPSTVVHPAEASQPAVRSWPFVVSEKFLTISIVVASVALAVIALRALYTISTEVIDFMATTVNGFLTKMGFPPAM